MAISKSDSDNAYGETISVGGNRRMKNVPLDHISIFNTEADLPSKAKVGSLALTLDSSALYVFASGEWKHIGATESVDLSNLSASNLTSGTVPNARLANSGTASSSTFLRGDHVWASPDFVTEEDLDDVISELRSVTVSLEDFGGKADGFWFNSVSTTAGSPILTSSSTNPFTSGMVGKSILVQIAGSGGTTLVTTVASYQSPTQVTLSNNASTTVSAIGAIGGTDNGPAWSLMLASIATTETATKVVLGSGKYFHGTGMTANLGTRDIRDLVIEGQGYSTQLLIAPVHEAPFSIEVLSFQNCRSILFEKLTVVGVPFVPTARGIATDECEFVTYRDCNFYGAAGWTQGVVVVRNGALVMENCNFYAISGNTGGGSSAIFAELWRNITLRRCSFIDHGVLDGAVITSGTGRAWLRTNNTSGIAALGQGVITLDNVVMDEGMKSGVWVPAVSNRTQRVNLRNVRVNSGMSMGGSYEAAFDLAGCDLVVMEECWAGYPGRPASTPVVRLTDVTLAKIHRCDFNDTPANAIVVDSATTLELEDTNYGSISGSPAGLIERVAGAWVNGREPYYRTPDGTRRRLIVANDGTVSSVVA